MKMCLKLNPEKAYPGQKESSVKGLLYNRENGSKLLTKPSLMFLKTIIS